MTERDRAAARHMGLVHALCRRFQNKGVEYEELFAAGCLGLTKALNGFDESRGLQFSTYAFTVIAGEIKRLFRDGGAVRVSRSLKALSQQIARLNSESVAQTGSELTVSRLAEQLHTTPERIAEAVACTLPPLSLTAADEGDGTQTDVPVPDIQETLAERLTLRRSLEHLPPNDRRLIWLRYYRDQTQAQTAAALGMTQVQVSRREKKLLTQLRKEMEG